MNRLNGFRYCINLFSTNGKAIDKIFNCIINDGNNTTINPR